MYQHVSLDKNVILILTVLLKLIKPLTYIEQLPSAFNINSAAVVCIWILNSNTFVFYLISTVLIGD